MSLLLSGPRLSHWDCQALGRAPPAANLEAAIAAEAELTGDNEAEDDTAGLFPLAISLIRSKGFLRSIGDEDGLEAAEVGGMPNCSLVKASGVKDPAANKGCKKGQDPAKAAAVILSSPNFGIFAPPGLSSLLDPDKSKGDSVSLEGDDFICVRFKTPAKAEAAGSSWSSCLRFLT